MNDFVAELIKKEVPEVAENIVKIYAIAREPGIKSKVAVYSTDKAIDPVGAIVGMNGNRVLAITKELRGERIDVIAWSSAPERFIASALTPADVIKVHLIDPQNHIAEVTVKDETLSAAIGKKGVNIKLASKLTQWDIQISNRKFEHLEEQQKKQ
jgi:N utilization substance protein A